MITFCIIFHSCLLGMALPAPMRSAIPDEDWGYVSINQQYDSNMFWWLYGAQNNRENAPLVMWLQGGPGGSSLFGDFVELGPLDVNLNARNTTWLQTANLLFVDNPIGTGFSYTINPAGFSTTDQQIADNLLLFLQSFLVKYPIFSELPFWIFCESYGGKMTSVFGVTLANAIKQSQIKMNFAGVALGDSWIDPIGCMYSYGPFLLATSQVNEAQADNITAYAQLAEAALNKGNGLQATNYWDYQQNLIETFTGGVNFYNWLYYNYMIPDSQLAQLLNGPIRKKLGIIPANVTWGGQAGQVFEYMESAFMFPSINSVDTLLKQGLPVVVYSGQLDLIVDVICTEKWMNKLTWSGMNGFSKAKRQLISINGNANGFSQIYENLSMYNIFRSGHMVPFDNGPMALVMFNCIVTGKCCTNC